MRLEYRILWFEDNKSWFDTLSQLIQEYLQDIGFDLVTDWYSNGETLDEIINNTDCDLILMDYNLAGISGDQLIECIRNHQLYTEIVFYSQNGAQAVRDKIMEKGADGVYCTSRDTFEFEDKVIKVIKTTIKKVQDVNNMRGLVMAETSELDGKMSNIVNKFLVSAKKEDRIQLETSVFKMTEDSIKGNMKKLERFREKNTIDELIQTVIFDSDKKRRTVKKILEILTEEEVESLKICMNGYKEEILDVRNILAHVKEEEENGKKILRSLLKGYEAIKFDDEMCIKIRRDIKKHANNLEGILKYLCSQGLESQQSTVAIK